MWAQLISTRIKPGREADLPLLVEKLHSAELPDSALLPTFGLQDQKDPGRAFVVVESEEKARARENDPRRAEVLAATRAVMAEIVDGAPEFVDLTVVHVA